jgi:hypothetical protein
MATIRQRAMAVMLYGVNSQWQDESGVDTNLWLCAYATDGTKVVVYFPDNVPPDQRANTESGIQETFRLLQEQGILFDTDPERYMHEMGRIYMGGSTDTKEFPTFDAAEQDAIATFQTPLDGADDEEAPDA